MPPIDQTGAQTASGAETTQADPTLSQGSETQTAATDAAADTAADTAAGGAGEDTTAGTGATDEAAATDEVKEPTAEEKAAAEARAVVPGEGESYALNLPAGAENLVPQGAEDPAVKALFAGAQKAGWSQGRVDDAVAALKILEDEGALAPAFDPAAELTKLGEGGAQRRTDAMTHLDALKARGDIDEGIYEQMASLVPTADGVRALEFMRKTMSDNGKTIDPPTSGITKEPGGKTYTPEQQEVIKLHEDPKYGKDPVFTKSANAKWVEVFGSAAG